MGLIFALATAGSWTAAGWGSLPPKPVPAQAAAPDPWPPLSRPVRSESPTRPPSGTDDRPPPAVATPSAPSPVKAATPPRGAGLSASLTYEGTTFSLPALGYGQADADAYNAADPDPAPARSTVPTPGRRPGAPP